MVIKLSQGNNYKQSSEFIYYVPINIIIAIYYLDAKAIDFEISVIKIKVVAFCGNDVRIKICVNNHC